MIGTDDLSKEKAEREKRRGLGLHANVPAQAGELTEPGRRGRKRERDELILPKGREFQGSSTQRIQRE